MKKSIKKCIKSLLIGVMLFLFNGEQVYAIEGDVAVDSNNFPDDIFRQYVLEEFDIDDDCILSETEINNIQWIDVAYKGITSLEGIEYFKNLFFLACFNNELVCLDVSRNLKLEYLACSYNKLSSLDVTKNTELLILTCEYNKLTDIDVNNNLKLREFYCDNNLLTKLNVGNNKELYTLRCDNNNLIELDVSKNVLLESIDCDGNQMASLDLSNNSNLLKDKHDYCYLKQNISSVLMISDDYCYIDMSKYFIDSQKIEELSVGTYDCSKKYIIFDDVLKVGDVLTYNYDVGVGDLKMEVSITISDINDMTSTISSQPETSTTKVTTITNNKETSGDSEESTTMKNISSSKDTTVEKKTDREESNALIETTTSEKYLYDNKVNEELEDTTTLHSDEVVADVETQTNTTSLQYEGTTSEITSTTDEEKTIDNTTTGAIKTNANTDKDDVSNAWVIWLMIILVVVLISGGIYFIIYKQQKNNVQVTDIKEVNDNDK